jgi:hypothetical protein
LIAARPSRSIIVSQNAPYSRSYSNGSIMRYLPPSLAPQRTLLQPSR